MSRYFAPITKEELATKILDAATHHQDFELSWEELCEPEYGSTGKLDPKDSIAIVETHGYNLNLKWLTPKVEADLSKVQFDTENLECARGGGYCGSENICGFQTLPNGLSYLGVSAGGDWESAVFFILYFDGKELRGYIPNDGNTWNKKTHMAYGNNADVDDDEAADRDERGEEEDCDPTKIIADITGRILPRK